MKTNRVLVRGLLAAILMVSLSAASFGQIAVGVSVRIGPPALPVYAQPICPGPGFMWTPGYWAWNDDAGYYWVPGTWVVAPVGMLWTPGYWGWAGGLYVWHGGYWGPHVGFYGGINYGYGYGGVGFVGGEWRRGAFYYNRSVTNVSVTNVTNVYNKTVIVNNTTVNNVSYNGGTGGVRSQPTPQEQAAMHEHHTAPLSAQTQHETMAGQNRQNFASVNQGKPAIAATAKAADFSSHSAIGARSAGGEYRAPAMTPKEARGPATPVKANADTNAGFRPFNAPSNRNAQTKTTGGPGTTNSNQGFRPFNPPGSNHAQSRTQPPTTMSGHAPAQVSNPPRTNPMMNSARSAPRTNAAKPAPPAPQPHRSSPPPRQNSPKPEHRGKF